MLIEILTAILVITTMIYAGLTHSMVKASEASVKAMLDQSEAMQRPYIVVMPFIKRHTTYLCIRIKNSGKTSARNLKLTLDYDLSQNNNKKFDLETTYTFSNTIENLAPNVELDFILDRGFSLGNKVNLSGNCPRQFKIIATYEFFEKKVNEVNSIDINPYILDLERERDPIASELENINSNLSELSRSTTMIQMELDDLNDLIKKIK